MQFGILGNYYVKFRVYPPVAPVVNVMPSFSALIDEAP